MYLEWSGNHVDLVVKLKYMCVGDRALVCVLVVYSSAVDLKAFRMTDFNETNSHVHTTQNFHCQDNAFFSEKLWRKFKLSFKVLSFRISSPGVVRGNHLNVGNSYTVNTRWDRCWISCRDNRCNRSCDRSRRVLSTCSLCGDCMQI